MLTQQLAEFVINTRESDVPAEVLNGARDALVDTLGCALAGSLDEGSEIAQRWVRETGARAQATVLGTPLATSPAEAAFANDATMSRKTVLVMLLLIVLIVSNSRRRLLSRCDELLACCGVTSDTLPGQHPEQGCPGLQALRAEAQTSRRRLRRSPSRMRASLSVSARAATCPARAPADTRARRPDRCLPGR